MTGTAASGRILLAAPIAQDEIEHHFADQIETAEEITFDRGATAIGEHKAAIATVARHAIRESEGEHYAGAYVLFPLRGI